MAEEAELSAIAAAAAAAAVEHSASGGCWRWGSAVAEHSALLLTSALPLPLEVACSVAVACSEEVGWAYTFAHPSVQLPESPRCTCCVAAGATAVASAKQSADAMAEPSHPVLSP